MCCGLRVCQLKAHQASGNPHEGRPLPLSLIHQAPRPRSRGAEPHTRLTTAPPIACLLGLAWFAALWATCIMWCYSVRLSCSPTSTNYIYTTSTLGLHL